MNSTSKNIYLSEIVITDVKVSGEIHWDFWLITRMELLSFIHLEDRAV
jgi:hypothetical protein